MSYKQVEAIIDGSKTLDCLLRAAAKKSGKSGGLRIG